MGTLPYVRQCSVEGAELNYTSQVLGIMNYSGGICEGRSFK